jgi:alginate O-acetyltransferase complex protein AlgJ
MSRIVIHTAGVTLFLFVLGVTAVQTLTGWLPEPPLAGATAVTPQPSLTGSAWWQGVYQKALADWFDQHLGFKGLWVRTANQIEFTLNGQLSARSGTTVVVGKDGWLYEKIYVDAFRQTPFWSQRDIETVSRSLRRLQNSLARHQIALLVLVSPSKATSYPEHLPEGVFSRPDPGPGQSDYRRAVVQMRSDGVPVLDASEILVEKKKGSRHPLFSKGSTHWNQLGAHWVLEAVHANLNHRISPRFADMRLRGIVYRPPLPAERDLTDLLNIWFAGAFMDPIPYPVVAVSETAARPSLLIIGSSFMWALLERLYDGPLADRTDFLYYYQRRFTYPGRAEARFDRENGGLRRLLMNKAAVVIEVNQTTFPLIYPKLVGDLTAIADRLPANQYGAAGSRGPDQDPNRLRRWKQSTREAAFRPEPPL